MFGRREGGVFAEHKMPMYSTLRFLKGDFLGTAASSGECWHAQKTGTGTR